MVHEGAAAVGFALLKDFRCHPSLYAALLSAFLAAASGHEITLLVLQLMPWPSAFLRPHLLK